MSNCDNCGAPENEGVCSYCGTGFAAVIRRVKQSALYVFTPKRSPKVAKEIQVVASSAAELREVAKKNAEARAESADATSAISRIDREVASAVYKGEQTAEIGQIYIRLDKYVLGAVREHYENLGYRFRTDIKWTSDTPPAWHMAEFDVVWLEW